MGQIIRTRNGKTWSKKKNWTVEDETLSFLYSFVKLVKPNDVLEIGTFEGDSAEVIAKALLENKSGKLLTIDTKDYGQSKRLEYLENVICLLSSIENLNTKFSDVKISDLFDMIFIDDGHEYNDVIRDLKYSDKLLKKNGYILGHDVVAIKSVNEAYQEFLSTRIYEHIVLDSFAGLYIIKKL
jgi:predicted O-methyltransferase YrrM